MTAAIDQPIVQLELRVRDLARACAFYAEAFGWRVTVTHPGAYALADTGRLPLIGLMQTADDGVPIGAVPYARTPDAGASAALVRELGGSVLADRTDAGSGFWAHTLDPWGNELAFWEPRSLTDPALAGDGRHPITWIELRAPRLADAVAYYRRLCGWHFQVSPGAEDFAFAAERGQVGVGLVGGPRAELLTALTPYVRVADLDETARRVHALGGQLSATRARATAGGTFRIFTDPSGNTLGLFAEPGAR